MTARREIGEYLAGQITVVEDAAVWHLIETVYAMREQRDRAREVAVRLERDLTEANRELADLHDQGLVARCYCECGGEA